MMSQRLPGTAIANHTVWADLPSCGLGNKLLIWGKAFAFATAHQLPLLVTGWDNRGGLRTWLKGGGWRRYQQDFVSLSGRALRDWNTKVRQSAVIDEPSELSTDTRPLVYRFCAMTHWSDYFHVVKPIRTTIRQELPKLLSTACQTKIKAIEPVAMAVHIRMGDFRPLRPGENFAAVGHVRTPLSYFTQIIHGVRTLLNKTVPVTVFTDGKDADLQEVLTMPGVHRAATAPAIVDIYRMAHSQLLVCAAGSTFSYWSAFLGDQPVIVHRDHIHQPIRPAELGQTLFEGAVPEALDDWPALLCQNLRQVNW